jgi:hypothetical protein
MKPLAYSLIVVASTLSSSAIEITNKTGVSFQGELLEILPNANGGPAAKIKRGGDGRIFSVPLNALSEKTLIEFLLKQSRSNKMPEALGKAKQPQPVLANQPGRPNAKREKKVGGFNIAKSLDQTAEDINVELEIQTINDGDRIMEIHGKLKNNSDRSFEFCKVSVELNDGKGALIVREWAFAEPSEINSKGVSVFEILIDKRVLKGRKIDSITYKVTGQR